MRKELSNIEQPTDIILTLDEQSLAKDRSTFSSWKLTISGNEFDASGSNAETVATRQSLQTTM